LCQTRWGSHSPAHRLAHAAYDLLGRRAAFRDVEQGANGRGEPNTASREDIVSSAPVFVGTRVPISTLFDYLAEGHSLPEYYDDFPGVTPAHTRAVLDLARDIVAHEPFPSRDVLRGCAR